MLNRLLITTLAACAMSALVSAAAVVNTATSSDTRDIIDTRAADPVWWWTTTPKVERVCIDGKGAFKTFKALDMSDDNSQKGALFSDCSRLLELLLGQNGTYTATGFTSQATPLGIAVHGSCVVGVVPAMKSKRTAAIINVSSWEVGAVLSQVVDAVRRKNPGPDTTVFNGGFIKCWDSSAGTHLPVMWNVYAYGSEYFAGDWEQLVADGHYSA